MTLLSFKGTYDTQNIHISYSYNIDSKYNGMQVSVIAAVPGKVKITGGEMVQSDINSSYGIELRFYRIIFVKPIYSNIGNDGFHLGGDIKTNYYYNCVFDAPTGGWNGNVNTASINAYNCLFKGGANSYYTNKPLNGLAQNCASTSDVIDPKNGTKTTCLTNVTVDSNYNITSEGWKNTGIGNNPDGSQANIGVYGGEFAWTD